MASQLLAAQIIPSLGITGLAAIPPGKLASHHDFIRLLFHHQHYNLIGFKGIRSVSCKLDSKTKKARCHEEGDPTSLWCDTRASCLQLGSPCLLAKVKENWETARLPLKDNDDHLFRVLEKVKSGYDKVGGRRGLTEADIEVLKKTTVNLAPQDWEKRILNDSLTSAVQHRMKKVRLDSAVPSFAYIVLNIKGFLPGLSSSSRTESEQFMMKTACRT